MKIDIESMDEKTKFHDIPAWDSFNNLMLILRFQEEMKVKFTAIEIEETLCISDLFSLLERKAAQK